MAGTNLLTLIDDIAVLLDDIAVMSKVAAKKTAGVLGDDLALNAQQVSGVNADRELPVVWAVAKGSFLNKLILVPLALLISTFIPFAITPLLIIGGLFLCFEGAEKLVEIFFHAKPQSEKNKKEVSDLKGYENQKIKGAIRTDFILSAEIIVISLGAVAQENFLSQLSVLSIISIVMTIGVYGLVAGIVKIDDAGLYLVKDIKQTARAKLKRFIGRGLLSFAPYLMKILSIVGTVAMFMVGGGIISHGISVLHHGIEVITGYLSGLAGSWLSYIIPSILNITIGILAGLIVVMFVHLLHTIKNKA
ncbi:hypothetical protein CJF42_14800 [Pseudoalteromonas sp. NBT06-2]|uniref:DUF808 domain-containing protein n=1 Tax=Pseudoalteromonas sp. NBT06-2 TaxID=2025950 RepID=UPI000BA54383|nr:DUF808 domain-containing protein [Pseudoalteromonas sp. NBT06-2]PAJ73612.1 hypothetical protein CJF42_14800 [Pseudoalteromonas sp. NBT06-2]